MLRFRQMKTLQKFASVHAQHAEAILGIMEGDAFDGTGDVLSLYPLRRHA